MIDKRTTRKPNYHGSRNPNAKLTEYQVSIIRRAYRNGYNPIELAKRFKTSPSNISNIVARRTWRHI